MKKQHKVLLPGPGTGGLTHANSAQRASEQSDIRN
jgi:hypothetical protein